MSITPTPSAPDEYGFADPVTPENVESAFAHLASIQDDPSQPIPETEPVEPAPIEPVELAPVEPVTPTAPIPTDSITIDGTQYPTALLREFIQFDSFLKLNPVAAERMRMAFDPNFNPQVQTPSTPAPITQQQQSVQTAEFSPPDELDLDDPTTKYLVDNLEAVRNQNAQFQQYLDQQRQQTEAQQLQQGIDIFTSKHTTELTPEDIMLIRQTTAQNNVLEGFVKAGHPLNVATDMALDYTMWNIPSIRSKLVEAQLIDQAHNDAATQQQAAAEATRQRRLSAISGSSGNASRNPTPAAPETGRLGLVRGIREALTESQQATS